jgi:hypothetical protein
LFTEPSLIFWWEAADKQEYKMIPFNKKPELALVYQKYGWGASDGISICSMRYEKYQYLIYMYALFAFRDFNPKNITDLAPNPGLRYV